MADHSHFYFDLYTRAFQRVLKHRAMNNTPWLEESVNFQRLKVGFFENNCYILVCPRSQESIIVDPAADAGLILAETSNTKVRYILITHGHGDHIGALEEARDHTRAPVGIHPLDAGALRRPPDLLLKDGQILRFGEESLQVIYTPGHSPGGICLLSGKNLFCGDTIFPNGPGNTSIRGADYQLILRSIHSRIFVLPDDTVLYPGHGLETTVGREKTTAFYPGPQGEKG